MARSVTSRGAGRRAPATGATNSPAEPVSDVSLTREQRLELYYWMRLTRSLEERLVNLYRQTKVVGGLFRSLGQEADAVGTAYALQKGDILSPLIRNLGSMLVKGATPVEILKQYMAKGDSPTRGRELNIHFGDTERGFIGQISPLGDMVPVMAGVTLTFRVRGEDRVGMVYVGDGATSTGAFHEGINFAAVQRCPLVVIIENNGYAYSRRHRSRRWRASSSTRRWGTEFPVSAPTAMTSSPLMKRRSAPSIARVAVAERPSSSW
jgi:pyruvate dehydrogenase E1 component alpha subunit/2-oxoisovalerate dehydrogenase E1 component alpha subunit